MSEQNVEIVRRVYELLGAGDTAAVLEHMDDGIEWIVPASTSMEPATYKGHQGFLLDAERFRSAWSEITVEVKSLVDTGPFVVAYVCWSGTAKSAALPVTMTLGALWTLENGKIVRFQHFPTGEAALDAVGLGPLRRRLVKRRQRRGVPAPPRLRS